MNSYSSSCLRLNHCVYCESFRLFFLSFTRKYQMRLLYKSSKPSQLHVINNDHSLMSNGEELMPVIDSGEHSQHKRSWNDTEKLQKLLIFCEQFLKVSGKTTLGCKCSSRSCYMRVLHHFYSGGGEVGQMSTPVIHFERSWGTFFTSQISL